jgi:hypothetical protein
MDDRGTAVVAASATVVAALIAGAVGFATGWFSLASKDEELRVHLVEIAIGILRADPKEDVTPARAWAIDVIEKNSGVKFNPSDRAALLHKPVLSEGFWEQSPAGQKFLEKLRSKDAQPVPGKER